MRIRWISVITVLVFILMTACSGPNAPLATALPSQTPVLDQLESSQAIEAAKQALLKQLDVQSDTLSLETLDTAQWPDTCLGLPQEGEACAQMQTDGFYIVFSGNGQLYKVRTNLSGEIVRIALPDAGSENSEDHKMVDVVRQALADRLGVKLEQVSAIGWTEEEWPNGCLGLEKPDEMCTMAIVPGYEVTLEVNGSTYRFRTNRDGSQMREDAGGGPLADHAVVMNWSRSGGLAGFCDQLMVFSTGQALGTSCKRNESKTSVQLSSEQTARLKDWSQRFASFTFEQKDAAVADAMTIRLVFSGTGQQKASDDDKAAMLEFVSQIYASNVAP